MKTFNLLVILFFGLNVWAESPAPAPAPRARVLTEADVATPEFQNCAECKAFLNNNPVSPQSQQLVINWDKVKSRYSFASLPKDDQQAILGHLGPEDTETLVERANRLNLSPKKPIFEEAGTVQEKLGDRIAEATGMGNLRVKVGSKKLMLQYKKKF